MARTSWVVLLHVVGLSQSAPQVNPAQVVNTVTNQLQPLISDAVARALRGSRAGAAAGVVGGAGGLTPEEEAEYNKKLSSNAQYEYGYKVADDDAQAYMAHQEVRNGQNVEGKYNYVDANGALVTVTYQAGPDGYTENREVQDDAVQMRNIPGPWEGPYADTVPAGVSVEDVSQTSTISARGQTTSSSSAVSQSALISQILSALQPQINTAVQSALSSSTRTVSSSSTGASVGSSFNSAQRSSVVGSRQSNQQSNLITNIIGTLQPQISGAVQAALSSRRPAPVAPVQQVRRPVRPVPAQRVVAPAAATSGITGIFGVAGENTVRIETPEFTIGY